jgi:hypothetical protein
MPIPTTVAPEAVAYFNVYVPASSNSHGDAIRIVERYLYSPYEIVEVVLSDEEDGEPAECYCVRVRGEFSLSNPESLVLQQRDRFSSGMYQTSEPRWLRSV